MNTKQKKALYESIMKSVAKTVKNILNESLSDDLYVLWQHNKTHRVYAEIKTVDAYRKLLVNNKNFDIVHDDFWQDAINDDLRHGVILVTPYSKNGKNLIFRIFVDDYKLENNFTAISEITKDNFTVSYWKEHNWNLHV